MCLEKSFGTYAAVLKHVRAKNGNLADAKLNFLSTDLLRAKSARGTVSAGMSAGMSIHMSIQVYRAACVGARLYACACICKVLRVTHLHERGVSTRTHESSRTCLSTGLGTCLGTHVLRSEIND